MLLPQLFMVRVPDMELFLITTKRGKSQKPRVTYSGMGSVQVARSNYKMLDTRMYMDMYNKQMHEEWLKLNGMGIYEGYVEKAGHSAYSI